MCGAENKSLQNGGDDQDGGMMVVINGGGGSGNMEDTILQSAEWKNVVRHGLRTYNKTNGGFKRISRTVCGCARIAFSPCSVEPNKSVQCVGSYHLLWGSRVFFGWLLRRLTEDARGRICIGGLANSCKYSCPSFFS